MDAHIRIVPQMFSEIHLERDGTTRELMQLKYAESFLLDRDHEIALLLDELRGLRPPINEVR